MDLTDFNRGKAWAIDQDSFEAIRRRIDDWKAGLDPEAASISWPPSAESPPYTVYDGVAVLPVSGPITKRISIFDRLFGGASVTDVTDAFRQALADPAVRAIVIDWDSPGGTVAGVADLSAEIYAGRLDKPVVSYTGGMMASAAYWIGSAAHAVVAASTAHLGSIGVLMVHTDFSKMDEMNGIKTTYLAAGKYKALGNDAEPLSDEARSVFREELEYIYSLFIAEVGRNRGRAAEDVRAGMADGRIFIGRQAVDAGLADEVGTLGDAIEMAAALAPEAMIKRTGGMPPRKETAMLFKNQAAAPSTMEELVQAYPALCAALVEQGAKSADPEAILAPERERIAALAAVHFGDNQAAAFAAIVASGVTAPQYAACRGAQPQPEPPATADPGPSVEDLKRQEMLEAITAAGAENPGAGSGGKTDLSRLPLEERAQAMWSQDPELREEFRMGGYAAYLAYLKNESNIRVFTPKAD